MRQFAARRSKTTCGFIEETSVLDSLMTALMPVLLSLSILASAQVTRIDPPAAPQSGMPFLTNAPDGSIYLSWVDPVTTGSHALRFSQWLGNNWTAPDTVATGKNWFVNWADFPAIAAFPDGSMLSHWLTRPAQAGKYGYGIRIAHRSRSGEWREVHGISLDEKEDYAGFLSFAPGMPAAIYLAPPQSLQGAAHSETHESGHRKTARFIAFQPDGSVAGDSEIDSDVCSCCQTAIGRTTDGLIAAYRDHQAGELRDISVVRFRDGSWTQPKTLHRDGWIINACPTEGPSIAASGTEVGVAWLTRANDRPRVQVALSHDAGATFGVPVRIDDGNPLGRPSLIRFDSNSHLAVWLEKKSDAQVDIRLRRIGSDGRKQPSFTVSGAPVGRSTGFPKVAIAGEQVIVAWREDRVRAALLSKAQFVSSGDRP